MKKNTKQHFEFLRHQAKTKFDKVRDDWCEYLRWAAPHRSWWIQSMNEGERKNYHIVDGTHLLALRSHNAGFLEGNTSSTRPWFRAGTKDTNANEETQNKAWLQHFTQRCIVNLSSSNFYNAAAVFYNDLGVVNTGAHYMEEKFNGSFHVHTLMPGSYYVIDNAYGEAVVLVRELQMNVKAVVDKFGKTKGGKADWSNFSNGVKKMYKDGAYSHMIDIVHVVLENSDFDADRPHDPQNRRWLEVYYEMGTGTRSFGADAIDASQYQSNIGEEVYLKRHTGKRKPFIVGKTTEAFEYGEGGPTESSLGCIKSLNKKAISKDMAIEHILNPATQGPASLRKSYLSHAPGAYVPIDARSTARGQKLESIFNINPAIAPLLEDVADLRGMVDKFYYADFLLYLSKNPKTRTARETEAIVDEQQRIVGPNLQSLNSTYNVPVVEWIMDWTLFDDPYLDEVPEGLVGKALKPDFISVFAQAQKAADLPQVDRFVQAMLNVGQIDPSILDKVNLDKYADIYEDRLYLPSGLNNPQDKVEAMREQAKAQAQRQQQLEQTLPAMAKAAKDASAAQPQNG